jgi:hypothetical protein
VGIILMLLAGMIKYSLAFPSLWSSSRPTATGLTSSGISPTTAGSRARHEPSTCEPSVPSRPSRLATGQNARSQNQTEAGGLWTNALVPLLAVMGALTAVALVGLGVAEPLDIGASLLSGVLVAVLVSAFSSPNISGKIGIPGSLLGAFGSTMAYYTSASEEFINLTFSPLTSSEALAIAVPDGDPAWAAGAAVFALIAFLTAILAGLRAVTGANQKAGAQLSVAIGFLFAMLAVGVTVVGALNETKLPANCNGPNRAYWQADQFLSWIGVISGLGADLMIGYGWSRGAPTLESLFGLGVGTAALAFSGADVYSIWHDCGTY